jgi:radical SAM protein with 4Fe4S-binding SPASM domain
MTTNGTLLRKNDFGILDSGIDEVNVSMAGVSQDDYLRVRGMKNYDEVRQNVRDLAAKKTERKWQTELFVNATATEQNQKDVPAFQSDFGSVSGVDGVLIRSLMDWQGTVDVASMEMRSGLVSRAKMFVKSHGRLFSFYLKARSTKNRVSSRAGEIPAETLCDAPYTSAGILWDGTVVPCCLDYNGTIPLGNINKQSFMEIWNGEPMNELRAMLKSVDATKKHLTCGPCRGLQP